MYVRVYLACFMHHFSVVCCPDGVLTPFMFKYVLYEFWACFTRAKLLIFSFTGKLSVFGLFCFHNLYFSD